jgi:hypothetical protein
MVTTAIFSAKPVSKNAGKSTIGLWIAACEYRTPTFRNPNQNSATFWRIFSSNKLASAKRKKRFYTNSNPNKQEVGFSFV